MEVPHRAIAEWTDGAELTLRTIDLVTISSLAITAGYETPKLQLLHSPVQSIPIDRGSL